MSAEAGWNSSTLTIFQREKQREENLKIGCYGQLAAPPKTWWFNREKTCLVIQKLG